jgi:hypothetical protein
MSGWWVPSAPHKLFLQDIKKTFDQKRVLKLQREKNGNVLLVNNVF